MGRLAPVDELDAVDGGAAHEAGRVHAARVVAEAGVQPVVEALPGHEHLAPVVLLGGGPVEPYGTGDLLLLHGVAEGADAGQCSRPVNVVAAAVARRPRDQRVLLGSHLVADAGQGVVLSLEPEDRLAPAPLGVDGRGHPGDAIGDLEAVLPELVGYELAAPGLH